MRIWRRRYASNVGADSLDDCGFAGGGVARKTNTAAPDVANHFENVTQLRREPVLLRLLARGSAVLQIIDGREDYVSDHSQTSRTDLVHRVVGGMPGGKIFRAAINYVHRSHMALHKRAVVVFDWA